MIKERDYDYNKCCFHFFMILSLVLQPFFELASGVFSYYDEIICLFLFFSYMLKTLRSGRISKESCRIIVYLFILLFVGLIGNARMVPKQPSIAVLLDILSNFKLYLFAVSIMDFDISKNTQAKLNDMLSKFIRLIIVILFVCAIISQFIDIGMTDDIRHNIKSFKFIFGNAAGLNTYYYTYMVIFSATIYNNGNLRPHTHLYLFMALVGWVLTLRSRAIAFAIVYLSIYFLIIVYGFSKKTFRFRWYHAIPIAGIAFLMGWSTFEEYFINNTREARYILIRGAIRISKDFLPFGSGFGSFGTAASRTYYSAVYSKYDMSNIWGLSAGDSYFITDQYWAGILGQFGVLGAIIVILLILKLYGICINRNKSDKAMLLASITFIFTSLLASIAAATYIQSSILASLYVIIILSAKGKANCVKG